MALNKWIGIGRLTRDIEIRTTTGGKNVASFSVAVNRSYKKGDQQETDFIDIVAWEQKAEFISRYFSKGDPIQIEGEIRTRNYQDKDGNNRKAFEVWADKVSFVEGYKRSESSTDVSYDGDMPFTAVTEEDDDVPF